MAKKQETQPQETPQAEQNTAPAANEFEIIAENSGGHFELLEAGSYAARCYSMIMIGTVKEQFQDQPEKEVKKVRLTFELPTELKVFKPENGEQPHVISKEFTLSMHEKAGLRKFLESWRGKGFTDEEAKRFNVAKLLGVPAFLNIIHKPKKDGNMRIDISSVMPPPKGMSVPAQINPTLVFSILSPEWNVFEKLPEFLQEKIKASKEYRALQIPQNETQAEEETYEHGMPAFPAANTGVAELF